MLLVINEIARGVVHDVNNALMVVLSSAKIMQMQVESAPLERGFVEKSTGSIENSCNKLMEILAGLITLSRSNAGEPLERCRLEEISGLVSMLVQGNFKKLGICLEFELAPELRESWFFLQRGTLTQLLLALLVHLKTRVVGKKIAIAVKYESEQLVFSLRGGKEKKADHFLDLARSLAADLGGEVTFGGSNEDSCLMVFFPAKMLV